MFCIIIYFSVTVCIWYMRIKLINSFKKRVLSTKAGRSFPNCGNMYFIKAARSFPNCSNMYFIKPYIIKFLSRL